MVRTILLLILAYCAPSVAAATCPAKPLPAPTGKYTVGTIVLPVQKLHGTGTSRQVQLWYPAQPGPRHNAAHYVPDPTVVRVLRSAGFLDQAGCVFDLWTSMLLPADTNVPIANAPEKFPFVMLSPGAGMPRFSYTFYAEQLASDGYIVGTIDFGEGGALVREGKLVAEGPPIQASADYDAYAQDMARHLSDVLNWFLDKPAELGPPLVRGIANRVDRNRIAAIGHSLGGAASLNACLADSRIKACVDLDGVPQNPVAAVGIKTSALLLLSKPEYTDAELIKKGRDPAKWRALGKKRLADLSQLIRGPGADAWIISVNKTGHLSFTDAPFTMQTALTSFGGTYLDPQQQETTTTGIIERYFDHVFAHAKFSISNIHEASIQGSRMGRE